MNKNGNMGYCFLHINEIECAMSRAFSKETTERDRKFAEYDVW